VKGCSAFRTGAPGLAALLLVAASQPAPDRDLAAIKAARSIVAEWALVNQLAAAGRLSGSFADGMRREARQQLSERLSELSDPASPAAREIARMSQAPARVDPGALRASAQHLLAIETQLEHP
jgi:hypothetical protein